MTDQAALSKGALDWVNIFCEAEPCSSVFELRDGVAFSRVLAAIAPSWFSMEGVKLEAASNWVLAQSNLKSVLRHVESYYHDVLGMDLDFAAVDVTAIARSKVPTAVTAEVLKVVEMLAGLAIQCEDKAIHIQQIMSLHVDSQTGLQQIIQQAMQKARPWQQQDAESDEEQPAAAAAAYAAAALTVPRADSDADARVEHAERLAARLQAELADAASARNRLSAENSALREQLAEAQAASSARSGQADQSAALQSTVAELKAELEKRDQEADDLRAAVRTAEAKRAQEAALRSKLEVDMRQIADELDLAQAKAAKLRKAEADAERYKARLQEAAVLKEHAKDLERQNGLYLEQVSVCLLLLAVCNVVDRQHLLSQSLSVLYYWQYVRLLYLRVLEMQRVQSNLEAHDTKQCALMCYSLSLQSSMV
jgi:HOOK domain